MKQGYDGKKKELGSSWEWRWEGHRKEVMQKSREQNTR